MTTKTKWVLRTTAGFALLVIFAYALAGVYAEWQTRQIRKDGESFLIELRDLRPGKAQLSDVERLARMHKRFLVRGRYYKGNCSHFDFQYNNGPLFRLHLATRTSLYATVCIGNNDTVLSIGVILICEPWSFRQRLNYVAHLEDWAPGYYYPEYPVFSRDATPLGVFVAMTPGATPEQVREAYAFNLACLDKIGGCHSNKELFRGPWSSPPE
jgi:hypothetical protein